MTNIDVTVPTPDKIQEVYYAWNKDKKVGDVARLNVEEADVGAKVIQNNPAGVILSVPFMTHKNVTALYELQEDSINVMVLDKEAIRTLYQTFNMSGLIL